MAADIDPAEAEEMLADPPPYVPDGWISTASLGVFWSGFNQLENYSVDQYDAGLYLSNSVGYKKGHWVYYFGGKVMQMETEYRYKANRFFVNDDISTKYNEFTFGLFGGVTYQVQTQAKHGYIIDAMLSIMQLPKNALDRSNQFYPALILSGWYID